MTDLQRIEISGFKGIEHLAYEPSGINLVTGRNNTGKTSLLEAIALAFDPTYVEEFGEDIDSLIHESKEECRIVVETEEETREMEIRHPTEEEAVHLFSSAITSHIAERIYMVLDVQRREYSWISGQERDSVREIEKMISGVVQNTVKEHLRQEPSGGLQREGLIFTFEGDDYPFLLFGRNSSEIINNSSDMIAKEIGGRVSGEDVRLDDLQNAVWQTSLEHFSSAGGEFGFINNPPDPDVILFLKSKNLLSTPDFDPDEDAVKRDKLGDYIKETGLVDDLKTFNLDTLIFQKEGEERYPVPYDFMGDGFKTVVGLLWELMDDEIEDQIILLEEPENHMHPGYVRKVVYFLVELAKDQDVQLFVTTHNKDFIDTFFSENLRDEEVEFLEDEFTLVRMESHSAVVEDYETARENVEDLHLDLRGI